MTWYDFDGQRLRVDADKAPLIRATGRFRTLQDWNHQKEREEAILERKARRNQRKDA
jgi:hypothetical protein